MYRFIKMVALGLSRMSPEAIDRLARVLRFALYDILRVRRKLMLRNLRIAFGDEKTEAERRHIARASFYHFVLTVLEFLRSVRIDILGETTVEDGDYLHSALARGQGVYMLGCHLGNWEALGASGTRFFVPAYTIVKEVGHGGVNRFVDEVRNANGLYTIGRKPSGLAMRTIRETLARGELVGLIYDQARPGAPRIPFFGTPAKTQTGLAALWRKWPAPIVPVSIRRIGVGRHRIRIWPPLELKTTGNVKQDILDHTAQFNRALEAMIRECPEQYFWLHNRWKS